MRGLAPPVVVAPARATPPLHGLVAQAVNITDPDPRWQIGFTYLPEACVEMHAWDASCASGVGDTVRADKSDSATTPDLVTVIPVTLETSVECGSAGWTQMDYEGRARRQAEAGTSKALEHEFWTGTMRPDNPHLTGSGPTVLSSTAVTPRVAMALLGQFLADCGPGSRGMIHATTMTAALWATDNSLEVAGRQLLSKVRGDLVVAGAGYPGTGPPGEAHATPAAGTAWAFATGMVQVRLSDIEILPGLLSEALDRRTNRIRYTAERLAAAAFDGCCCAAVLVDLTA